MSAHTCLKLTSLDQLVGTEEVNTVIETLLGPVADRAQKLCDSEDEDRCIRCALCAARCPVQAITMERVTFSTSWRSA